MSPLSGTPSTCSSWPRSLPSRLPSLGHFFAPILAGGSLVADLASTFMLETKTGFNARDLNLPHRARV